MENTYDLAITTPSYGYDHTIVRQYTILIRPNQYYYSISLERTFIAKPNRTLQHVDPKSIDFI